MAAKRLSAAQVEALASIANCANRPLNYSVIRRITAMALVRRNLLSETISDRTGVTIGYSLTEQGRDALAAHKLLQHHRAGDVATLVEMVADSTESEL